MSKEQVANLWSKYKNFGEKMASMDKEWEKNVNELKPLIVECESKEQISSDLSKQNKVTKDQLDDNQEQLQKISDESALEKSILEFFSQTLEEYNEYNPNQDSPFINVTGNTNVETDNGITARVNGIDS